VRRPEDSPIIADRAAFVEALQHLLRGDVLVRMCDASWGRRPDGAPLRWSFQTLLQIGLIARFQNLAGFQGVDCDRITGQGRWFARRALDFWHSLPHWQHTPVRPTG
jgi:hypothetical protein